MAIIERWRVFRLRRILFLLACVAAGLAAVEGFGFGVLMLYFS
ncbi:hypothetical protein EIKCOROL_01477 [Eikenella corrodens ATCC 23834]|uniref:Uncharacterized protein n=1 Tax=Eikenella corrodens ATCC 23834 TaxID=546274 RepID=C0DVT5_EIKCO|nr:hypothetical protein EIKCOROL_01477 [Eikenella corrodens ATCC 23834]